MRDLVQVKKDKLETTFFTEEEALKELLHSPDKYMYNPAIRDQGRCGCYLRRLHTQVHDDVSRARRCDVRYNDVMMLLAWLGYIDLDPSLLSLPCL